MSEDHNDENLKIHSNVTLLEQYKIFVEGRDKYLAARREHTKFFITALFTEALLGLAGLVAIRATAILGTFQLLMLLIIGILGAFICIYWGARDTLMVYNLLAKSCVIDEMEQRLGYPCNVKQHEYYKKIKADNASFLSKYTKDAVNRLADQYFPYVFLIAYLLLIIYSLVLLL
jgi:hypothetical protein